MDDKLNSLLENEGMSLDRFLGEFAYESVVPGICMNDGCEYTTDVEPDQDRGWCEICGTQTVSSGFVLAGVI